MSSEKSINITDLLSDLIINISNSCSLFSHIDPDKVTVCIASSRSGTRGGIWGKLVPLRFENGSRIVRHRDSFYAMPEISRNSISQLYLVYFYMPRFFDLDAYEKLKVVFHELYHIDPGFNGDIRRMAKVKAAHGHSRKHFDLHFKDELDGFFSLIKGSAMMDFLSMNSLMLYSDYSRVMGYRTKVPRPEKIDMQRAEFLRN